MNATIQLPVKHTLYKAPILNAMKSQKVTAQDLAREKGCTNVTISRVLNGRTNSPELLTWICERLHVPLSEVAQPCENTEKNLPED